MSLDSEEDVINLFRDIAHSGAKNLQDDAAELQFKGNCIVSSDMLVEERHFFSTDPAYTIGCKAIRVNVSDIISKGALPRYVMLSIKLADKVKDIWVNDLAKGIVEDCRAYGIQILGGDTVVGGNRTIINVTIFGILDKGRSMVLRSGAKVGDDIYVTGLIGESSLGLEIIKNKERFVGILNQDEQNYFEKQYLMPPFLLGIHNLVANYANASMDISDGLLLDISRIASVSGCKAVINANLVPLSSLAKLLVKKDQTLWDHILGGGDDYQILMTANPDLQLDKTVFSDQNYRITKIGKIVSGLGVECRLHGKRYEPALVGYDHFKSH